MIVPSGMMGAAGGSARGHRGGGGGGHGGGGWQNDFRISAVAVSAAAYTTSVAEASNQSALWVASCAARCAANTAAAPTAANSAGLGGL